MFYLLHDRRVGIDHPFAHGTAVTGLGGATTLSATRCTVENSLALAILRILVRTVTGTRFNRHCQTSFYYGEPKVDIIAAFRSSGAVIQVPASFQPR